jgi:hypothetical protein
MLSALRDGPCVSTARSDPTRMAWKDRSVAEAHLDFLEASLDLRGRRVLDIRSRSGWLLDALRRRHGADVYAMPAFEAHAEFIRDLFGIPAEGTSTKSRLAVLARTDPSTGAAVIPAGELDDRLEGYRRWRDLSILSLPEPVQRSFSKKDLKTVRRRAVRLGDARRTKGGVIPNRPLKLMPAGATSGSTETRHYELAAVAGVARRSSRS